MLAFNTALEANKNESDPVELFLDESTKNRFQQLFAAFEIYEQMKTKMSAGPP